jgi:hypothetical protein
MSQAKAKDPAAASAGKGTEQAKSKASSAHVLEDIIASTATVMKQAKHVAIDSKALEAELNAHPELYTPKALPDWRASSYHYSDPTSDERTAQYVLVLDALNFCFWPLQGYEYDHLV